MRSITARLLIAASVVIVAFFGLTGLALDKAFRDSAYNAVRERLQAQVYMLLGAANMDAQQQLQLPKALPEVRFLVPDSGLYAMVLDHQGQTVWRSDSLLGQPLPALPPAPARGNNYFGLVHTPDRADLLTFGFSIAWELNPNDYRGYTFWVAENESNLQAQVNSFRRSLWFWLLAAGFFLTLVQVLILRWSLQPLRQVAREVVEIEAGQRSELTGRYPRELQPLTTNLNALVKQSRTHLQRYRNALGDLAHSLKTPLAVLSSAADKHNSTEDLHATVRSQVERMNKTVEYQLQRAAASGRMALSAPLSIVDYAGKIRDTLSKVYAAKQLRFALHVPPELVFRGDEGDLLEVLGNLTDNACKWARHNVRILAFRQADGDVVLQVEDDGPGIPLDQRERILARGGRADPSTPGHGIGLAVVSDIVQDVYQGQLAITKSELGGACIRVLLPH